MIPLIRPSLPDPRRACEYLKRAEASRTFSNFGQLHELLAGRLATMAGGYALPVATGTAAIEVALRTIGLAEGARVALPDFTHAGTLLAVLRAGLKPVLFGVDPETWTLRIAEVEKAVEAGMVAGAVVVSPFGYAVDFEGWELMQDRTGAALVYDLAGAFGNFPRVGNPRCYSLHATKNLGVGEGGFVVFPTEEERACAARLINFDTMPDRTIGSLNGFNYKMDEVHAAFLLAALEDPHLEAMRKRVSAKAGLLSFYEDHLPSCAAPPGLHFPSLCVLSGFKAESLEAHAPQLGAVIKRYYPLLSRMPACAGVERASESCDVLASCCALPSDVSFDEAYQVLEIVDAFT